MAVILFTSYFVIVCALFIVVPFIFLYKNKNGFSNPEIVNIDPYIVNKTTEGAWNVSKLMQLPGDVIWSQNQAAFTESHYTTLKYPVVSYCYYQNIGPYVKICDKETSRSYWWQPSKAIGFLNGCSQNQTCTAKFPQVKSHLKSISISKLDLYPLIPELEYYSNKTSYFLQELKYSGFENKVVYWKSLDLRIQGIQYYYHLKSIKYSHSKL